MTALGEFPQWTVITTVIAALIGNAGLGYILKTWLDHKRGMRKATDEVAMNLVVQLNERTALLEQAAVRERGLSAAERVLCDAKLRAEGHKVSNLAAILDVLLMIGDMPPAKQADMVKRIKERRAEQEKTEALEKARVTEIAAKIAAGDYAVVDLAT